MYKSICGLLMLLNALIFFRAGAQAPAAAAAVMNDTTSLIANNAKPELISRQFSFTEGPAVDKKGNVFFTDQPNNKIWKYDTNGNLSVFVEKAGRSNGMYFDKKGNLITCADEKNELWSIKPNGKVKVLLHDIGGQHFNGPNDLWIHPGGDIYFTDPYYQRDYWTRQKGELTGQHVYLLKKNKAVVIATDSLVKPNGIVGTADGKLLYVADIQANKTYRFNIEADGRLTNRALFVNKGSDGITLDERGNLYLTGKGIHIYDPAGKLISHIDIPEPWTANLCFGGKDRSVLFITASTALYKLQMNVKGM